MTYHEQWAKANNIYATDKELILSLQHVLINKTFYSSLSSVV